MILTMGKGSGDREAETVTGARRDNGFDKDHTVPLIYKLYVSGLR